MSILRRKCISFQSLFNHPSCIFNKIQYNQTVIIAEIGTAHGGSVEKGEQLITAASEAGADAVKFQWVYADEILHPDTGFVKLPGGSIPLYERFRQLEVPSSFFAHMLEYAHAKKVQFICSPFGLKSLDELLSIHPDAVKIASPEVNHFPMLKALAAYRSGQEKAGKEKVPVIISSGVSKLGDIEKALDILGTDNCTLLHCITCYPAPEDEYNIRVVQSLHDIFGIPTGISDHSLDPVLVPSLATAYGGTVTEKHITLSRKTDGLDDPVALEPEQFALMVHCIHQSQAALHRYGTERGRTEILKQLSEQYDMAKIQAVAGNGIKHLAPSETANYGRTNRSLHFMHAMKKGDIIHPEDIAVLRTEKILSPGISPEYLDTVTGACVTQDITAGSGVQWEYLLCR